jgi:hypothetical protein
LKIKYPQEEKEKEEGAYYSRDNCALGESEHVTI